MIVGAAGPVKHFMLRYRRAKYAVRGGGVKSYGHPHGMNAGCTPRVRLLSMGAHFGGPKVWLRRATPLVRLTLPGLPQPPSRRGY